MSRLDEQLQDLTGFAETEKLLSLVRPLRDVALRLAAAGHADAAFLLWEPLLSGGMEPDGAPTPGSVHGDAPITMLCHLTGRPDLGRPSHRARWEAEDEGTHAPVEWVQRHQQWGLQRLLMSRWSDSLVQDWIDEPAGTLKGDVVRLHRAFDRIEIDAPAAVDDLEALGVDSALPDYARIDLCIVAADRAAHEGRDDRADQLLRTWLRMAEEGSSLDFEAALGLPSVAQRLLAGALTEASGVRPDEANAAAANIRRALDVRLAAREGPNPPRETYEFAPSYGTVVLEPRVDVDPEPLLATDEEFDQGFAVRASRVAIYVPDSSEDLVVTLRVVSAPTRAPDFEFDLDVIGDLYLRRVDTPDDLCPFAVPPGAYRAAVQLSVSKEPHALAIELVPRG